MQKRILVIDDEMYIRDSVIGFLEDFGFDVIDYNKTKSKIIIDGMDSEGNLFHEEKIVDLK